MATVFLVFYAPIQKPKVQRLEYQFSKSRGIEFHQYHLIFVFEWEYAQVLRHWL